MQESRLDLWTKELVRASAEALRGTMDGLDGDPILLGQLSQRLREVLARELPGAAPGRPVAVGLSEELAMAAYLTVAAEGPRVELSPHSLISLNQGLSRALRALGSGGRQEPVEVP